MNKIKEFIATKILGLKLMKKHQLKQLIPKYEVILLLHRYYKKHDNLTPSRSGFNLTYKRFEDIIHDIHFYEEGEFKKHDDRILIINAYKKPNTKQ